MSLYLNVSILLLSCIFLVSDVFCVSYGSSIFKANNVEAEFRLFIDKYKKIYTPVEYQKRLSIFASNLKKQYELNQHRGSTSVGNVHDMAWYGVTKFSDLTPEEFQVKYLSGLIPTVEHVVEHRKPLSFNGAQPLPHDLPMEWDWRKHGVITTPRDQTSQCGSCWAFSSVETVEAMYAMNHSLTPLSVQQVIDCSMQYKSALYGCRGGDTCTAFDWMMANRVKVQPDKDYPLKNRDQWCQLLPNSRTSGITVASYTCADYKGSEKSMLDLLMRGPISVGVDASNWNNYQGGVIQYHCGEVPRNHAVQIVGYNQTSPIPYYIVKNSWGTDFGHDGYLTVLVHKVRWQRVQCCRTCFHGNSFLAPIKNVHVPCLHISSNCINDNILTLLELEHELRTMALLLLFIFYITAAVK